MVNAQGINDYINSESVGMSLLKILLCLGNPTGISPFFKGLKILFVTHVG